MAVPVGVGHERVGAQRRLRLVGQAVAVVVVVAGVAQAVAVGVRLVHVARGGAVVAGVTEAVAVGIPLPRVGVEDAYVLVVRDAVAVRVADVGADRRPQIDEPEAGGARRDRIDRGAREGARAVVDADLVLPAVHGEGQVQVAVAVDVRSVHVGGVAVGPEAGTGKGARTIVGAELADAGVRCEPGQHEVQVAVAVVVGERGRAAPLRPGPGLAVEGPRRSLDGLVETRDRVALEAGDDVHVAVSVHVADHRLAAVAEAAEQRALEAPRPVAPADVGGLAEGQLDDVEVAVAVDVADGRPEGAGAVERRAVRIQQHDAVGGVEAGGAVAEADPLVVGRRAVPVDHAQEQVEVAVGVEVGEAPAPVERRRPAGERDGRKRSGAAVYPQAVASRSVPAAEQVHVAVAIDVAGQNRVAEVGGAFAALQRLAGESAVRRPETDLVGGVGRADEQVDEAVDLGAVVAGAVAVLVRLVRVEEPGAVVADVADAVAIPVGLVRVGVLGADVGAAGHAVDVQVRLVLRHRSVAVVVQAVAYLWGSREDGPGGVVAVLRDAVAVFVHVVARDLGHARRRAAVPVGGVAVVALLALVLDPVAASGLLADAVVANAAGAVAAGDAAPAVGAWLARAAAVHIGLGAVADRVEAIADAEPGAGHVQRLVGAAEAQPLEGRLERALPGVGVFVLAGEDVGLVAVARVQALDLERAVHGRVPGHPAASVDLLGHQQGGAVIDERERVVRPVYEAKAARVAQDGREGIGARRVDLSLEVALGADLAPGAVRVALAGAAPGDLLRGADPGTVAGVGPGAGVLVVARDPGGGWDGHTRASQTHVVPARPAGTRALLVRAVVDHAVAVVVEAVADLGAARVAVRVPIVAVHASGHAVVIGVPVAGVAHAVAVHVLLARVENAGADVEVPADDVVVVVEVEQQGLPHAARCPHLGGDAGTVVGDGRRPQVGPSVQVGSDQRPEVEHPVVFGPDVATAGHAAAADDHRAVGGDCDGAVGGGAEGLGYGVVGGPDAPDPLGAVVAHADDDAAVGADAQRPGLDPAGQGREVGDGPGAAVEAEDDGPVVVRGVPPLADHGVAVVADGKGAAEAVLQVQQPAAFGPRHRARGRRGGARAAHADDAGAVGRDARGVVRVACVARERLPTAGLRPARQQEVAGAVRRDRRAVSAGAGRGGRGGPVGKPEIVEPLRRRPAEGDLRAVGPLGPANHDPPVARDVRSGGLPTPEVTQLGDGLGLGARDGAPDQE